MKQISLCIALLFVSPAFCGQDPVAESNDAPTAGVPAADGLPTEPIEVTLGMHGQIKQVVLPGSELKAKDVDPRRTPIAVRIDNVYPHGSDFRYDLTFFGLEPGAHDIAQYLQRIDGSDTSTLPALPILVRSILPAEQLSPLDPARGWAANVGGYRNLAIAVGAVWLLGLLLIIFWKRSTASTGSESSAARPMSEVEHIHRLVDTALESGSLSADQKAELDLRVIGFWRERKKLGDTSAADAIAQLKQDAEAGPLLKGLERWFYSAKPPEQTELKSLLEPLRALEVSPNPEVTG